MSVRFLISFFTTFFCSINDSKLPTWYFMLGKLDCRIHYSLHSVWLSYFQQVSTFGINRSQHETSKIEEGWRTNKSFISPDKKSVCVCRKHEKVCSCMAWRCFLGVREREGERVDKHVEWPGIVSFVLSSVPTANVTPLSSRHAD